jgi:hypothetical protein
LTHVPAALLHMNEIASVEVESVQPLYFDAYQQIRSTGSFILIDPLNNATVAAGMIQGPAEQLESLSNHGLHAASSAVTDEDRRQRFGHAAACVWIDARPRVAELVERSLFDQGWHVQAVGPELSDLELIALGKGLRRAGAVAVFSPPFTRAEVKHTLQQLFTARAFFHSPDREESDLAAALDIVRKLHEWRETASQERSEQQ